MKANDFMAQAAMNCLSAMVQGKEPTELITQFSKYGEAAYLVAASLKNELLKDGWIEPINKKYLCKDGEDDCRDEYEVNTYRFGEKCSHRKDREVGPFCEFCDNMVAVTDGTVICSTKITNVP